mgnify:CR=1 FL=1
MLQKYYKHDLSIMTTIEYTRITRNKYYYEAWRITYVRSPEI